MSENVVVHGKSTTQATVADANKYLDEPIKSTGNALHILDQTLAAFHSPRGPLEITNGDDHYETVAASQTAQVLGDTGATGDQLARLILVVATAATAATSIKDGADSAISIFPNSPGGGIGTYVIEVGLRSRTGAWQVTTGAGVSVIAVGHFT